MSARPHIAEPTIDSSVSMSKAESFVRRWVPEDIQGMTAYLVPPSAGLVKLDAMENPYPLPGSIRQGWLDAVASAQINRYPDASCTRVRQVLGNYIGLPDACRLVLGNGSDDLIQMLAMLLGGRDRVFMAPTPSFSMYRQICLATGTRFAGIPLRQDFSLDLEDMLTAIDRLQPACVFLAYPNNPTGNAFDLESIRTILGQAPGLVVIDEAYHAFCGKSFIEEIPDHPNALLLRTLSKNGLAGLRLGMAVAGPDWTDQLEKLRLPYNINALTQAAVAFIVRHAEVLDDQTAKIVQARTMLHEQLSSIRGIEVFPSETNFLLVRMDSAHGFAELKARKILVKDLHGSDPALERCLRITVSTPEENDRLLAALREIQSAD